MAPVVNLSGSQDLDTLRVTDLVASEFLALQDVAVVPVNLALAELSRQGKQRVETARDAASLARVLGADGTVVTAITEYSPYYPPVVGMVMQWYPADGAGDELSDAGPTQPRWQVQRVFNAADTETLKEVKSYAARCEGHESPYGWKKYLQSQELYLRFCSRALIEPMTLLDRNDRMVVEPSEARQ